MTDTDVDNKPITIELPPWLHVETTDGSMPGLNFARRGKVVQVYGQKAALNPKDYFDLPCICCTIPTKSRCPGCYTAPVCSRACQEKIGGAHLMACSAACDDNTPYDLRPEDKVWPERKPGQLMLIGYSDNAQVRLLVHNLRTAVPDSVTATAVNWFGRDYVVLAIEPKFPATRLLLNFLGKFRLEMRYRVTMQRVENPDTHRSEVRYVPLYGPSIFALEACASDRTGENIQLMKNLTCLSEKNQKAVLDARQNPHDSADEECRDF